MEDKRKAWAVMGVVFFASIVVAINQFKVPPVMQVLMSELDIGMAAGGWLMSAVSVAAIVLAIPAAFLLTRWGPKVSGLVALGCVVVGSAVGAVAQTFPLLLLGRLIEGVALGLVAVVAPAVISMWFEPKERGLPMGIWAAWVPIGNVIIFNLAHPVMAAFGWRSVWWLGVLAGALAFVVYALVVTVPPQLARPVASGPEKPASFGRMLLNSASWLLAVTFAAFSFAILGYNTWAPTYLSSEFGMTDTVASFYASLMFMAAIPSNFLAGWVINRTQKGYHVLVISFAVSSLLFFLGFRLPAVGIVAPFMIALGFASNFIPTAVFTLAPETMPTIHLAGLALAIVAIGSGGGGFIGPPVLGGALSGGNWGLGSIYLLIVMVFGTITGVILLRKDRSS